MGFLLVLFAVLCAAAEPAAPDKCEDAITEVLVACAEQLKGPVVFQECIGPATRTLQKAGCAQATFSESAMGAREKFEARGGQIAGDDFKRPKSIAHRIFLDKDLDMKARFKLITYLLQVSLLL